MAGRALEERVWNQQADTLYFLVLVSTDSDSIRISPSFSACRAKDTFCEKSHLPLWRRGCCLCCQLLWNLFSMFVGTAMLWSNYPHNLCVLRQVEIVSTQVGNAGANTPKLRMASTSLLFLVSASVFKPTKMGMEVSCLFCVSEVMTALVSSCYGRHQLRK